MTAHQITALAYLFIGFMLVEISLRIWNTKPLERPFVFGQFLMPLGLKIMLSNLWMLALAGIFIFSCGVDHWTDEMSQHKPYPPEAVFEAIVSWAFAIAVGRIWLLARWRQWRAK